MSNSQKNWTPDKVRNKTAETWQGYLYFAGVVLSLISWLNFSNDSGDVGFFVALGAIAAFFLGSLIKTTWIKRSQVDIYVKDKAREDARMKAFGVGIVSSILAAFILKGGGQEAGGFFALVGIMGLIIGGLMPIKWVKQGELGGYK